MPNIKSAIKRVKVADERRAHNAQLKSAMRSAIKSVEGFVAENNAEQAKVALLDASKKIDKAARKGIIEKNTAARYKSRLAKKVNGLSA